MFFKFIGYGDAFDYKNGDSAVLVKQGQINLLIDCGYTVYGKLREYKQVNIITHVSAYSSS